MDDKDQQIADLKTSLEIAFSEIDTSNILSELLKRAVKEAVMEHGSIRISTEGIDIEGAPPMITFAINSEGELDMF